MTGETLKEQGVTHNVKAMVLELKQSEEDVRKHFQVEEEKQNEAKLEEKRIQRTKRGLEILAERGTQSFRLFHSRPRRGLREWAGLGWRVGGITFLIGLSFPTVSHFLCPHHCFLTLN